MNKPHYILVDGSALLFRSYHAMPALSTSKGFPTGAIKGFSNSLNLLNKRFPDSQIAVIFDYKGPSFRHTVYEKYKAHRPEMAEDLAMQIQTIFDFVRFSGYPLIEQQGYEADDIIATYCRQATAEKLTVYISSNDKDLAQLVNSHVFMYDSVKNLVSGRHEIFIRYGVFPEQIRDFLTLTGDSSDNIPGVEGVGPKTAAKWLGKYKTLEALITDKKSIPGKAGEKLRDAVDKIIPLARQLVTLADCPLETNLRNLQQHSPDQTALISLGKKLEMRLSTDKLPAKLNSTQKQQHSYQVVTNETELQQWVDEIQKHHLFAFDCETDGLDFITCRLIGISLALPDERNCYIPCAHNDGSPQIPVERVFYFLQQVFHNKKIRMVGQNLKFDLHVLEQLGIQIHCQIGDTMLQSYCLNPTSGRHDLDTISQRYLSWTPISYEDLVGKEKKTFDQLTVADSAQYAAEDAWLAMRLHTTLSNKLQRIPNIQRVYNDIEIPVMSAILAMERNGARIDADKLHKQSETLEKDIHQLVHTCYELAGMEFNIDSPKQLQTVLFDYLQLPSSKKTSTGQSSTSESVLAQLAHTYQLPAKILEYRTLKKLKSTYTDKLPSMIHPHTHRLHSSFRQAVAATGRLSSTSPNLQNIPIRTAEGRRVREAFIPEEGNVILSADYSQIELRIMAHLSGDSTMIAAFEKGEDIHQATAAEIFSVTKDAVSAEQRRSAKAINFGLIYGMSAFGLAQQLGIGRPQAQSYIDTYFKRYPGVRRYMDSTKKQAHTQGFVETIYGRRLYLPNIKSTNHGQRMASERAAINAPMQGTAADIIKLAMVQVHKTFNSDTRIKMILQVHDELVFELPPELVDSFAPKLKEIMVHALKLDIPLEVGIGTGNNWLEAH